MLNAIFLLITDFNDLKGFKKKVDIPFYFSYLNAFSNKEEINDAYVFFTNQPIENFSISILADTPISKDSLSNLITFLFIPTYYNIENKKLINILCENDNTFLTTKKILSELAINQGINNLIINQLTIDTVIASTVESSGYFKYIISKGIENFKSLYEKVAALTPFKKHKFFINFNKIEFDNLYFYLKTQEENIKNLHPLMYEMASTIDRLEFENKNIMLHNSFLKDELNNYKEHVEILKSSHQAKDLQTYYHNQYEILPLWYKRLGHLIKLLIGKRTFKSLFTHK